MAEGLVRHLLAFVVRWAVSAGVLMLSVGWVSPGNRFNTFARAVLVSAVLTVASYVTLSRFLWFLLVPWLVYAAFWLATIMGAYDVRFGSALLVALALTLLSWVVSLVFGTRGL